jgi:uncharacterized protein
MKGLFIPKAHYRTVQDIELVKLKAKGITNLLVDLDETLRKRNSDFVPEASLRWLKEIQKQGFKVCITSNNVMPWKTKQVADKLGLPVTLFALKPMPFAFKHGMLQLGSTPKTTAMIGDQLFTDILGANMLGIYTILVAPITGAEKGLFRRIMRWLEQKVFPRVKLDS